jgi:hypothetical protein
MILLKNYQITIKKFIPRKVTLGKIIPGINFLHHESNVPKRYESPFD